MQDGYVSCTMSYLPIIIINVHHHSCFFSEDNNYLVVMIAVGITEQGSKLIH